MLTPDFPAWRHRFAACGRRRRSLRSTSLPRLDSLLGSFFPAGLLSPTQDGPNSRERIYSLRRTFFAFLYQVLHPGSACRTVVRQVQALFQRQGGGLVDEGTGAHRQARERLPLDTLQRVRSAVAARAQRLLPPSQQSWYGLHPMQGLLCLPSGFTAVKVPAVRIGLGETTDCHQRQVGQR